MAEASRQDNLYRAKIMEYSEYFGLKVDYPCPTYFLFWKFSYFHEIFICTRDLGLILFLYGRTVVDFPFWNEHWKMIFP